ALAQGMRDIAPGHGNTPAYETEGHVRLEWNHDEKTQSHRFQPEVCCCGYDDGRNGPCDQCAKKCVAHSVHGQEHGIVQYCGKREQPGDCHYLPDGNCLEPL